MKNCVKCNLLKPLDDFYSKGKNRPNNLQSYCKDCHNNYCMLRWKQRKRDLVAYKGGKCEDCGLVHPREEVYQLHHLDPSEKDVDWGKLRLRSWNQIVKEADKCALLCANCHILRHSNLLETYL